MPPTAQLTGTQMATMFVEWPSRPLSLHGPQPSRDGICYGGNACGVKHPRLTEARP